MIENPTMKQASYSLTPPLEWQINIYCYFLFHTQSSGFSHQTNGNFSQRIRHGKFKNAQKNIERREAAVVYYSMKNLRGRIGSTRLFMRGLGCNADSSNFGCELRSGPHSAGQCCHINDIRNGRSLLKRTGGSILVRSQQLYFSRSRMGSLVPNAHARGAAVAQRLHSELFGGGETRHANAEATKVGGLM
jgi:hypothetical protein